MTNFAEGVARETNCIRFSITLSALFYLICKFPLVVNVLNILDHNRIVSRSIKSHSLLTVLLIGSLKRIATV